MAFNRNPDASGVRSVSRTVDHVSPALAGSGDRVEWSDEALMVAVVNRDEAAFAVLYDRYVDLVYSASVRVLADSQLAEDATQDIFVRLWRRPEAFVADRGCFVSWLMSVVRNRSVDELRSRGRRQKREGTPGSETQEAALLMLPAEGDDPLRAAQVHEDQRLVRRALVDLPADQRTALELAYFGGLTQQEIAIQLGEPLGTVKTRIRLGMQKLRRALQDKV
ncbi:MAG: sigma-70 family RNA polymerase sigma factor [Dehalococcoidia bacterium]|nr:sigma-70 family RNA polymerase sigma factor [Dehalococcoidia bacterium]